MRNLKIILIACAIMVCTAGCNTTTGSNDDTTENPNVRTNVTEPNRFGVNTITPRNTVKPDTQDRSGNGILGIGSLPTPVPTP